MTESENTQDFSDQCSEESFDFPEEENKHKSTKWKTEPFDGFSDNHGGKRKGSGRPKGKKNKRTKKNSFPPGDGSKPRGGEKATSLADDEEKGEKKIKLYGGFMLTLNPVNNIYFQTMESQKEALQKVNDIVCPQYDIKTEPSPYPDFKIVRYDSNIEKKKNRKIFVEDPNIHGHTYYTFWTYKMDSNTCGALFHKYFHEQVSLIGEYHLSWGKDDHIKRNYQYIYKDKSIHPPWAYTLDELEYGTAFIEEMLTPKVYLYEEKEYVETHLNIRNELDRYQASSKILQNISLHYNLKWNEHEKCLQNEEKIFDYQSFKDIFKTTRYLDRYQCLLPYIEKILIENQKREIYFNDRHVLYI